MTRLLVSVRDAEEATAAMTAGAGLIDFKDPSAGALGALASEALERAITAVGGERPTSATAGDLPADPDALSAAAARLAGAGLDYVKVGLWPGARRREAIVRLGREFTFEASQLVGVLLADADPDFSLIPIMAEAGFAGAMLDVAGKGCALPDVLEPKRLAAFIATCRDQGLISGLAGSLRIADIPRLAALGPDVLGFRGGLCDGFDRTRPLDPQRVAEAVETLRAVAS